MAGVEIKPRTNEEMIKLKHNIEMLKSLFHVHDVNNEKAGKTPRALLDETRRYIQPYRRGRRVQMPFH